MSKALKELLKILELETIEQGYYRGQSQDLGFKALFGGHVMGQAVSAALKTVPEDRHIHSLHSYFLRPGDAQHPVLYEVENIRDGKSISTRRIKAVQHGKTIFFMTASFQHEVEGFDHQDIMPKMPEPLSLPSYEDYIKKHQN